MSTITISKLVCFVIIGIVTVSFVAVIIGLSVGLKSAYKTDCAKESDTQKLEICKDLSCKNPSILQNLTSQCLTSGTSTPMSSSSTLSTASTVSTTGSTITNPTTMTTIASTMTNPTTMTTTASTMTNPIIQKNYRLPKSLKPYMYDLTVKMAFDVFTEPFTFDGTLIIKITCLETTNSISLHKRDINITSSSIVIQSILNPGTTFTVLSTTYDEDTEIVTMVLSQSLQMNQNYTVSMNYIGETQANNFGFYKSFYYDSNGAKRWLVTSQMESTDARSALPCFDEPAMKAQFKLSVIHNKGLKALSNMPETLIPDFNSQNNLTRTNFDVSVPMSSYLLALIVSDFDCKYEIVPNMGDYGNVTVGVCGRPDVVSQGQLYYALQNGVSIIKFYEDFYSVKYPLPKCDHIAIPDFDAGAMENWGLITYRESVLIYDPSFNSYSQQEVTVVDIAHELAHMWFGDLVTMVWWNDIWLNEGFATYVEYVGTDHAEKDFEMFEQFVEDNFGTLDIDSVANSRAISMGENEINTPDEISALFDSIAYGKGGALIRMMNYMISESTFSKGIKNYLEKYKYGNTVREDLWNELEKAAIEDFKLSNFSLTEVMNTWTLQLGHPLITIERIDSYNIRISQKQFLYDPTSPPTKSSPYNYKWFVPFTYSVEKLGVISTDAYNLNTENLWNKTQWLKQSEDNRVITLSKPLTDDGFILGNLETAGFYRVNYDSKSWANIIQQLNSNKNAIPTRLRAQTINDAFALSQSLEILPTQPLEIIRYLTKETEYLPWSTAITRLSYLTNMLDSTNAFGNYQNFVIDLVTSLYNGLGWDERPSDKFLQKQLRTRVLSFACERDFYACVSKAKSWYSLWMQNEYNNPIPGNYRNFIYCTAIRNGGVIEWEFASAQYDKELQASQRTNIQRAMACAKDPWLISRYLNDQINSTKVRLQDASSGIAQVGGRTHGNLRTWTFVKDNWEYLVSKISMGRIVTAVSSKFNTQSQLEDFQKFFNEHPNQGSAARDIRAAIDKIKANIRWMSASYNQINSWFISIQNVAPVTKLDYRLPTDLVPYHYDVKSEFQFVNVNNVYKGFPYNGETTISFICAKSTSSLVFHIKRLDIDNSSLKLISLTDDSFTALTAFNWNNDFTRQFFIANLTQPFKAGHNYTVSMKYLGYLTDDNAGFYRSSYINENNDTVWLMTSQLESTDARKSFPCFDEPAMKAQFTIRAIHQNNYTALSNMPEQQRVAVDGSRDQTDFETTPFMSTYLIALVVSDFVCINGTANSGLNGNLPIRSCGRPNANDQLGFGLDVGIRSIEVLQDSLIVKYPLPKEDHIAIPDFAAGAMENWGLVTYRQAQYLFKPGVTVQSTEQSIAGTVTHEIAHMWFGDIVTLAWWDDTWLNEGFARYFEYTATAALKPSYQMIDQFKNLFLNMLVTDGVYNSRSISYDVSTPNEISNMFDSISYSKGGSVLEMVSNFLGNDTFFKGLNTYLSNNSYSNTNGKILWDILDKTSKADGKLTNMTLNDIMNTWMKQMGYPVVTIKRVDNQTVNITQNHFLIDPLSKPIVSSPFNYTWYVPFTHSLETVGVQNTDTMGLSSLNMWEKVAWLKPTDSYTIVKLARKLGPNEFVLANLRASGFYRVNYDNYYWDLIIQQLNTDKTLIPAENRAQFIHDSFAFSEARMIDGEKPFQLIEFLSSETKELVWLALINRVGYFYNMLVTTSVYGGYQKYMSSLVRNFYNKIGWYENLAIDSWMERQLRTNTVLFACLRGVSECIETAKLNFNNWTLDENINPIPSGFRSFVYCTVIREGGEQEWNFAAYRFSKESSSTERQNLLNGMSCTRLTWLVDKFLENLSNQNVVNQTNDAISGFRAAAIRPDAILKTWTFVKSNWNQMFSRFGVNNMAGLVTDFSSTFNTPYMLNDFNSFFNNNPDKSLLKSQVETASSRIQRNVLWYNKYYTSIKAWFDSRPTVLESDFKVQQTNYETKGTECLDCSGDLKTSLFSEEALRYL